MSHFGTRVLMMELRCSNSFSEHGQRRRTATTADENLRGWRARVRDKWLAGNRLLLGGRLLAASPERRLGYCDTRSRKRYRTGLPSLCAGLNRHALAAATIMAA
jgi:hypothetical protein